MPRRADQKLYDITVPGDYPDASTMVTGPVEKTRDLKYARNPKHTAAMYKHVGAEGPCLTNAEILKAAKDPGYINIEDLSRALRVVRDIRRIFPGYVSSAVIKHEIPCGGGRGDSPYKAFTNAWDGDPLSAYGGVIAITEEVDKETATALAEKAQAGKIEWLIAPSYSGEAMDILDDTGIRLMEVGSFDAPLDIPALEVRDIDGGYLVGDRYETKILTPDNLEVKFGSPTEEDIQAALLNWVICGHTKSNAVVVGDAYRAHGIGSGQTSRVDAAMLALYKTFGRDWSKVLGEHPKSDSLVGASDAFWPFPDGPALLGKAGIRGCVYPTGSDRDGEVFAEFRRNDMFVLITRPEPQEPTVIERAFY